MRLRLRQPERDGAFARYASAELSGRRTPWRAARWCALDFELTGLDPDRDEIISFGAIPIEDGRLQLADAASGLIKPQGEIGEASIPVHGLRAVDLVQAPSLTQAIESLLHALSGATLVAHTAEVERAFLDKALARFDLRLRGPIIDTEVLGLIWLHERGQELRPRIPLAELAAELGLPAERPHDALGDALTTAQVFIALASHLDAAHSETVGSLARAGRRLDGLKVFH